MGLPDWADSEKNRISDIVPLACCQERTQESEDLVKEGLKCSEHPRGSVSRSRAGVGGDAAGAGAARNFVGDVGELSLSNDGDGVGDDEQRGHEDGEDSDEDARVLHGESRPGWNGS